MLRRSANNNKFDFDIGHIKKSPCRECDSKDHLPNCSKGCMKLDRLRALSIGCTACSRDDHDTETYSICLRNN
jgi:hypothetical protein